MPVRFSPPVFFLQVSNELLRTYFARRGELTDFPWRRFTLGNCDPAFEAWCALPEGSREESESELRAVAELGTREGLALLVEQARLRGIDITRDIDRLSGLWHRAFWVFVVHPDVFDAARQLHHVDHLHGRYWRTRGGLVTRLPDESSATRSALGEALSAYFRERQGGGEYCDVHCYHRAGKHWFLAYPQDVPESVLGYEEGALRSRSQRPVFEVVYAFDPAAGTLDLHARGDRRMHEDLQKIYSRVVLGADLPPETLPPSPYRIDRLKRRGFPFPVDPADQIQEVRVKALRLRILGGGRLTFDAGPIRQRTDVYDLMERTLDGERLPLSNVDVDVATLQLVFAWAKGPRTLTFNLRADSCNLRDAPEHLVARRCLRRWEFACA